MTRFPFMTVGEYAGLVWLVAVMGFYYALLAASAWWLVRYVRGVITIPLEALRTSPHVPPVSIIVPAYNEQETIVDSVEALFGIDYPEFEIIVVNDGSTDTTLERLTDRFQLKPVQRRALISRLSCARTRSMSVSSEDARLVVVDTDNGGKGRALNAGITVARFPLVCTIDADSLLERDALLRMARVHMIDPERIVAVGGMVRVGNGCDIEGGQVARVRAPRQLVPALQAAEYIRTFVGGRMGWTAFNALPIISGAFGLFRRDMVLAVGGYSDTRPGEDMGIVLAIHHQCRALNVPYRIEYCPDAVCWTQAPVTLKTLGVQRRRWARGNLRNIGAYGRLMLGRPRYGVLGLVVMPYMLLVEVLGPYWMAIALALVAVALMRSSLGPAVLALAGALMVLEILLGWIALFLDDWAFRRYTVRDVLILLLHMLHMPFWYYFVTSYWRVVGHVQWIRRQNPWGTMSRVSWKA